MPRRNLEHGYGENSALSVRLTLDDRRLLAELASRWGCPAGEALRRCLRLAARGLEPGLEPEPELRAG